MQLIVSLSTPNISGRSDRVTIEHQPEQYVLIRYKDEAITSRQTFTTQRELRELLFCYLPSSMDGLDQAQESGLILDRFRRATDESRKKLQELSSAYPSGFILIGRESQFLHMVRSLRLGSHPECYISRERFISLRDREELTTNPEVQRTELQRDSYTIGFYIEGDERFSIPFQEIDLHAVFIDGIRVAAIEHVLALTIDKAIARYGSTEGIDDRDDVVRLVCEMTGPSSGLLLSSLNNVRLHFLHALSKDMDFFLGLHRGNSGRAREHQIEFTSRLSEIESSMRDAVQKDHSRSVTADLLDFIPQCADEGEGGEHGLAAIANLNLLPVRMQDVDFDGKFVFIRHLCKRAGVSFRYLEGYDAYIGLTEGTGNIRAANKRECPVYLVDRRQFATQTPQEEALRILEVVAHAFHNHTARWAVRGLFR
jgi:hypothetical protein